MFGLWDKFLMITIIRLYCVCRHGSSYVDNLGFASLTVWNMKTWKAMVSS